MSAVRGASVEGTRSCRRGTTRHVTLSAAAYVVPALSR